MRYFTQKVYWTVQISWWLFTTFVLRFPTTKFFNNPNVKFSYLIVSFLICISLTHSYAFFFQKKFRDNKKTIFFALVGVIVTGGTIFLLDYYFGFQRYRKPSQGIPLETYDYFQFFIESIRYVGLWFLFYHLIISNSESHLKAVALAQSETDLKTAELANLKNQLNPHFLFNAINSIKALTLSDPHLARNALTELSQLLRTSLTMGNEQLVTLETEISFVKDYLFLEKIRYENRLNYSLSIDKNTLTLKIPPMSLQLLVENAIKHGIGKCKAGGEILIKSTYKDNIFQLSVINSGKLKPNPSQNTTGVGIKNLKKRLFFNFQEIASFTVREENNQVIASITISYNSSIL
jgi:two-component system, LytTR family, sensor kinase